MTRKWDNNDKIILMKTYAGGGSYAEIGKMLDRSPNAVKLRLETIVYQNLVKGKNPIAIANTLNTDIENIKKLYYAHKSFREGRGLEVANVNIDKFTIPNQNKGQLYGGTNPKNQISQINQINQTNHISQLNGGSSEEKEQIERHKTINTNNNTNNNTTNNLIERLDEENELLERIVKNYKLKRDLKKLYIGGKLDEKIANQIVKIINK